METGSRADFHVSSGRLTVSHYKEISTQLQVGAYYGLRQNKFRGWKMKFSKKIAGLFMLVSVSLAQAMPVYLVKDHGVNGVVRNCQYSNGKIYSVNATDLCELSIEDGGPLPQSGQTLGFLSGESQDGMTKVCVYDVLGQRRAIRLNASALCPLNQKF